MSDTTNVERTQREDVPAVEPPEAQFWQDAAQRSQAKGMYGLAIMFRNISYTAGHTAPRVGEGGVRWE
jgi:hypothetical protein